MHRPLLPLRFIKVSTADASCLHIYTRIAVARTVSVNITCVFIANDVNASVRANDYALDTRGIDILQRGNLESGDRPHRMVTESACVARFFHAERILSKCYFEILEISLTITIAFEYGKAVSNCTYVNALRSNLA